MDFTPILSRHSGNTSEEEQKEYCSVNQLSTSGCSLPFHRTATEIAQRTSQSPFPQEYKLPFQDQSAIYGEVAVSES